MNRVPVVPWSTAATYFVMLAPSGLGLDDAPGDQDVLDEEVVDEDAEHPADERPHDRDPEVPAEAGAVARQRHVAPPREEREQPGAEVPGRVDRVAGVGAVG